MCGIITYYLSLIWMLVWTKILLFLQLYILSLFSKFSKKEQKISLLLFWVVIILYLYLLFSISLALLLNMINTMYFTSLDLPKILELWILDLIFFSFLVFSYFLLFLLFFILDLDKKVWYDVMCDGSMIPVTVICHMII